ncbi:phosphotransferase [Shewanella sairae]|uniref:Phosphotransferase n=1 Tax=Shewanella sairae TaxID=190310 RepID=A0ABQ4PQU0_9GAMM|nr:phosphotransferase [Shewanella sairae]MCL1130609.1 ecdysteroid 22-kinase family protein [Shewanella sairae]GIU51679.1 phosphotransferase [Shewanella sairae]
MQLKTVETQSIIKQLLQCDSCVKKETIQSLWSGYGDISRYEITRNTQTTNTEISTLIVKHISPPQKISHPRSWANETSHKRKLDSYLVEVNFYRNWASKCNKSCPVPKLEAEYCSAKEVIYAGSHQNATLLLLSDLDAQGYAKRAQQLSALESKVVLSWLAHFHALFLSPSSQAKTDDLWSIGSYWHLATRKDELQATPESPLKSAAYKIDKLLNNSKYQTIIHGDAKLANFCFNDSLTQVAAVDFQYTGYGIGVKDVIYFLGSCLSESVLENNFELLMHDYFSILTKAINQYHPQIDAKRVVKDWSDLVDLSWADFERFLAGWAPTHNKRNKFSQRMTQQALSKLK